MANSLDQLKDGKKDFHKNDPQGAREFFEQKLCYTTGPAEVHSARAKGVDMVIIDVRDQADFDLGHIPGALNLPKDRWHTYEGLSADKINVLYCYSHVCHLAARAGIFFASAGFSVKEMDGGIAEWKAMRLPLEGTESNPKAA